MAYENNDRKDNIVYGKKVNAGKKRTYFFDVKETRNNSYALVITESRRRLDNRGYDRSSIHIHPEDLNKFTEVLDEVVNHIKTEILPNYDFDVYANNQGEEEGGSYENPPSKQSEEPFVPKQVFTKPINPNINEEVDRW